MRIDIFLSDYKGKIIVYEDIEKLEYMLQSLEADYASGLIAKDKYNYLHGQYLSKINNLKSGNVVIKDTSNQEKNMAQQYLKLLQKLGNSSQWFSINKNKILIGLLAALCIFVVATVVISAGILDLDSNTKIVINSTNNTSSVNNTTDTSNDISDSGSSSSDGSSSGSSVSSGSSSSGSSSSSHHSSGSSGGGSSGGGSSSGGSSSGISPGTTIDGETEPPGLDA